MYPAVTVRCCRCCCCCYCSWRCRWCQAKSTSHLHVQPEEARAQPSISVAGPSGISAHGQRTRETPCTLLLPWLTTWQRWVYRARSIFESLDVRLFGQRSATYLCLFRYGAVNLGQREIKRIVDVTMHYSTEGLWSTSTAPIINYGATWIILGDLWRTGCLCVCVREREWERERERERERESQTGRQRETDRERETETGTDRQTETETETDRYRERREGEEKYLNQGLKLTTQLRPSLTSAIKSLLW